MRNIDLTTWEGILVPLIGLTLITLIGVSVRLFMMMTIQQRRERRNRQINERLRTLIAAYRTLGGSFTGELAVDPTHLRDLRNRADLSEDTATELGDLSTEQSEGSDRRRRIRDAVEAALSDVILLGTEQHVHLAARAANELAAGRAVHTYDLVVSLRDFIRNALDLDPVPSGLSIPVQGPVRPVRSGSGGGKDGRSDRGSRDGGGGGGGMGMGMGMGMGGAAAVGSSSATDPDRS